MELIRKDELLKRIQNVVVLPARGCGKSYTAGILNNIMKAIETAPTVDAVPVIHAHLYFDGEGYERCSNCNEHETGLRYFTLCPHCGAKMDGGQDG